MPVHAYRKSGEGQSERVVLAMDNRRSGMADRGGSVFFMEPGAQEAIVMTHRCKRMCQRISGIKCQCAFQKHQCLRRPIRHPGVDVGLGPQHKIVGVETIRTFAVDTLYFGPTEARLNRAHNR